MLECLSFTVELNRRVAFNSGLFQLLQSGWLSFLFFSLKFFAVETYSKFYCFSVTCEKAKSIGIEVKRQGFFILPSTLARRSCGCGAKTWMTRANADCWLAYKDKKFRKNMIIYYVRKCMQWFSLILWNKFKVKNYFTIFLIFYWIWWQDVSFTVRSWKVWCNGVGPREGSIRISKWICPWYVSSIK